MRGDTALTLRLLLRGPGLAGLLTAAGGGIVVAGALRPWYAVVAEVTMLGADSSRTVASSRGASGTVTGGSAAALGAALVPLGLLAAFDRSPRHGRGVSLGAGMLLLGLAAVAVLRIPAVGDIAPATAEELLAVAAQLPVGVVLQLRPTATAGPWWILGGATTAVIGAVSARER